MGLGIVAVGGVVGAGAVVAQSALNDAVPLAAQVQDQVASGDITSAAKSVEDFAYQTARAESATDTWAWRAVEGIPFVGHSLTTVRELSRVANDLADRALAPLSAIDLASLRPVDGQIDLAVLGGYAGDIEQAATAFSDARRSVDALPSSGLVGPVAEARDQFVSVIDTVEPALQGAAVALPLLPEMLGGSGPRNYLVLVQNNAEARGAGGISSAMLLITADQGRITIGAQARSRDFDNARDTPIVALSPEVVELYADKVARYIQDVTSMPDFELSAEIAKAFWAESMGTPVDAVLAIDPVALSYILAATGPLGLANGDVLDAENATSLLFSDVYARYANPVEQDVYFAAAAERVFGAIASGSFEMTGFLEAMNKVVEERRLLYTPFTDQQRAALAGSRVLGELPADNVDQTTLGVYVNDLTEGKMNYYTDMSIFATSDQCLAASPTFTTTVTFTNAIEPAVAAVLPNYVHTERNYPKGVTGTDMMFYGPVGARFVSASIDGVQLDGVTQVEHLGRPAARMNFTNAPMETHQVTVVWQADPGGHGPLTVANTPMVKPVPIFVDVPGC